MTTRLSAITGFALTTDMPERLVRFYSAIGFVPGPSAPIPARELESLGLSGRGTRIVLTLGDQRVALETFEPRGRPYPTGANAADLCFQHLALVTRDAAATWARVHAQGARPISVAGAVTLPATAGGVTAVKFRDPEGHPLELLQFPAAAGGVGGGDRPLRIDKPAILRIDKSAILRIDKSAILRIDHSAISVADVAASRRFYEALGLSGDRPSVNHGPTQAALDGLAGARVDVQPMRPPAGPPHLELLCYRHPVGRPAGPARVNDIVATRILWQADHDGLLTDPDGHLHRVSRLSP